MSVFTSLSISSSSAAAPSSSGHWKPTWIKGWFFYIFWGGNMIGFFFLKYPAEGRDDEGEGGGGGGHPQDKGQDLTNNNLNDKTINSSTQVCTINYCCTFIRIRSIFSNLFCAEGFLKNRYRNTTVMGMVFCSVHCCYFFWTRKGN